MVSKKKIVDGCTATTYMAYALSEVATLYPITPVESMGEMADEWGIEGRKNLMGQTMIVREMQSEKGAAGATHGCLSGGALATTFTGSQGLMLMIPNMYKIAGEMLPGVFHIGARTVASHALSIFDDHSDVMACRQTGFAFMASASVQECLDLTLVAHLSAIDGSLPFLHFFDGWRTSSEMHMINMIDYKAVMPLVNWEKVDAFRKRAMNSEHPDLRGTSQDADVFFQYREAANPYYDALPGIVDANMRKVERLTGRAYHLFDYCGDPNAEYVIVSMASSCEVVEEAVNYLNTRGYKTGCIKVRLYRPFSASHFLDAIPASAKMICALDRTKEPGSEGEPLYQDICTVLHANHRDLPVIGGRYGLSSKEFTPSMVKTIFDYMAKSPDRPRFTIGINDDVTHLSLPTTQQIDTTSPDTVQCKFFGFGSDGTVGASKQAAEIIGENTSLDVQAYFIYGPKKSGNYTISELRFAPTPIKSAYRILNADYISCSKDVYVHRFNVLEGIKEKGVFVLNSGWTLADMERELPAAMKKTIAGKQLKFYNIDASKIASEMGLGVRTNMIMETVFFKLTGVLEFDKAVKLLKNSIKELYGHEGAEVVKQNFEAVDRAVASLEEIHYPDGWKIATEIKQPPRKEPPFIRDIFNPIIALQGDSLPVSAFQPDGFVPLGTAAYEKRYVATAIPQWDPHKCWQCCDCSLVCSHATIRPFIATDKELEGAPASFDTVKAAGDPNPFLEGMNFRIQVYPSQCLGCEACVNICPGHALTMTPINEVVAAETANLDFAQTHISQKENLFARNTVKGSQFYPPLLEFSGACAGCGETPYVKLMTQLFGERMIIANATGCSSIWGGSMPSIPYTTNRKGHGPAWGNSLFEDNAEYGYGIAVGIQHRRKKLELLAQEILNTENLSFRLKEVLNAWVQSKDDGPRSYETGQLLLDLLAHEPDNPLFAAVIKLGDLLGKKTVWCIGGDGWAYDIGYGGLDHVVASGQNIKMLVLDTECYSNTGGQTSKATPLGAMAKYSMNGKRTYKKELGRMLMMYGYVYVASIAIGASEQQAIDALTEAEAYDGPAVVLAYCPCINQGIRKGMGMAIPEEAHAVRCGYWPLYRYNPALRNSGKDPLIVDYRLPDGSMPAFLNGEDRYIDLVTQYPEVAKKLRPELEDRCNELFRLLSENKAVDKWDTGGPQHL